MTGTPPETSSTTGPWLVGIFVGGQARRFGGAHKGLLTAPDGEAIVPRLARVAREALGAAEIRLVGNAGAYASFGLATIADAPSGAGPIGGLRALLEAAAESARGAIALAGDMPRVDAALVSRLSAHAPAADAVAPRTEDLWQPLFARYDPLSCLPAVDRVLARRERALQAVFLELGDRAEPLPVGANERAQLVDWDRPEDVT